MLFALMLACVRPTFVPHCDSTSSSLAWDEDSALGFSAADVVATLRSSWSANASTLVSGQTPILLAIAEQGEVLLVDQSIAVAPDNADVASLAVICDDYLAVGVDLDLSTGDGQVDDVFSLSLQVPDPDGNTPVDVDGDGVPKQASFATEVDADQLDGSIDLNQFSMDGYYAATVSVSGEVHSDGSTDGTLQLLREGDDGDTAYQVSDALILWGDDRD